MSEDLKIEGMSSESALILLANEQRHTTRAINRLITELKEHRETVDKHVTAMDDRVRELETGQAEREILKNQYVDDTVPTLADLVVRVTAIETARKTHNGVLDLTIKLGPMVVAVILMISGLVWSAKNTESQIAELRRAPATISQTLAPPR